MFSAHSSRGILTILAGAGMLISLTGCDPLVKGASAGLAAAAEYFVTTPIQFWIDDALAEPSDD